MMNKIKYIIVGTGFKTKYDDIRLVKNIYSDENAKINIGSAVSLEIIKQGFDVILISKTESKLQKIKESLEFYCEDNIIETYAIDILNEKQVISFVNSLDKNFTYYLVHSVGLSSGQYNIINDNPYLPIEKTDRELIKCEFESVIFSLFNIIKGLLPYFRKQKETRIVIVSSMSSVRAFPNGFSHTSAKGALHQAIVSLRMELNKENIYISEVLPGMVDTGYYDSIATQDAVKSISINFGYEYKNLPLMPPSAVAETVKLCLLSEAHILQINLVSKGQFPNLCS